jgi:hypothetical protein
LVSLVLVLEGNGRALIFNLRTQFNVKHKSKEENLQ